MHSLLPSKPSWACSTWILRFLKGITPAQARHVESATDWQFWLGASLQDMLTSDNGTQMLKPDASVASIARYLDARVLHQYHGCAVVLKAVANVVRAYRERSDWMRSFEVSSARYGGSADGPTMPMRVLMDDVFPYVRVYSRGSYEGWLYVCITLRNPVFGQLGEVTWGDLCVEFMDVEPGPDEQAWLETVSSNERSSRFPVGRMSYPVWFQRRQRRICLTALSDRDSVCSLSDELASQYLSFFPSGTDVSYTFPWAHQLSIRLNEMVDLDALLVHFLSRLSEMLLQHAVCLTRGTRVAVGIWFDATPQGTIECIWKYGDDVAAFLASFEEREG